MFVQGHDLKTFSRASKDQIDQLGAFGKSVEDIESRVDHYKNFLEWPCNGSSLEQLAAIKTTLAEWKGKLEKVEYKMEIVCYKVYKE